MLLENLPRAGLIGNVVNSDFHALSSDQELQFIARSLSNDSPFVDYRNVVRQLVRFFEVLGRQQDRSSVGHQLFDDIPQR